MTNPIFVKFDASKKNGSWFGEEVWIDMTKIIMFYEYKANYPEGEHDIVYISFLGDYGLYINEPIDEVRQRINRALYHNK